MMAPLSTITTFIAASAFLLSQATAQAGPNTLAKYNPANRTMSANQSALTAFLPFRPLSDCPPAYCILPISKAAVRSITGHDPLAVPTDILPAFPPGMHPLIVQAGYINDIRMTALNLVPLQIDSLMQGSLIVPYLDVTKDGKTAIGAPAKFYIGGTNNQPLEAIVPSVAAGISPFEGTTTFPATFVPDTAAAQSLPNGFYSQQVKLVLVPNPVSGPGVIASAYDMLYALTKMSPYTDRTFHALLNIPQLLNNGKCQRNTVYFNESFADPKMAMGSVTLYYQLLAPTPPAGVQGQYEGVYCYQANGQSVSALAEDCAVAAANMDPKSRDQRLL